MQQLESVRSIMQDPIQDLMQQFYEIEKTYFCLCTNHSIFPKIKTSRFEYECSNRFFALKCRFHIYLFHNIAFIESGNLNQIPILY